jgi:hypothetical protein
MFVDSENVLVTNHGRIVAFRLVNKNNSSFLKEFRLNKFSDQFS